MLLSYALYKKNKILYDRLCPMDLGRPNRIKYARGFSSENPAKMFLFVDMQPELLKNIS